MKYSIVKVLTGLALGAVLLNACSSDDPEKQSEVASPKTLVEASEPLTWSVGELQGFLTQSGLAIDLDAILYDVSVYQITYKTDYKGDSIDASAMVFIPNTDETVSTFSFQHGTIASDAEAPSNLSLVEGQNILLSVLAGTGFIAVAPDYIGFGASVDIVHPYYVENLTATAVVNAIYASRQVAQIEEINMDNELYLAGYSQGGYATMAAHKFCEGQGTDFFELKASFPASGGYDIKSFQEYFFDLDTYHQPFFMAYVAYAFQESLDLTEDLSGFFNEPYASAIPAYFDGSMTGSEINEQLTDVVADLVNPDLLENIDSDDQYAFIREAFEDNSPIDFVPQVPLFMYHGNADITVPYENSVQVYNEFIAQGATDEVVSFTTMEGGTHSTGVAPYLEDMVSRLLQLEE